MHCKTRNMRVVEIRTNDRFPGEIAAPSSGRATIVATDGESYLTLSVKTENVGKFPSVGQTAPVDIYFNKED